MTNTDEEKTTDAVKYKVGLLDMSDLIWFSIWSYCAGNINCVFMCRLLFPDVYRLLLCSLLHVNVSWTRYEKYASRKSIFDSGNSSKELSSCSLSVQNGQNTLKLSVCEQSHNIKICCCLNTLRVHSFSHR